MYRLLCAACDLQTLKNVNIRFYIVFDSCQRYKEARFNGMLQLRIFFCLKQKVLLEIVWIKLKPEYIILIFSPYTLYGSYTASLCLLSVII